MGNHEPEHGGDILESFSGFGAYESLR